MRAQALEAFALTTPSARSLAERYLERFACDAQAMPADEMHAAVLDVGLDPIAFAQRFGVRLSAVLRRLASLSGQGSLGEVGLVIADSSGTFTYRKPIDGFDIPRFGAACPIWPLFQALSQPERPLRAVLEQTGARHSRFLSFAVAEQLTSAGFDSPAVFETTMLFTPHLTEDLQSPQMDVGPGCRVCPRESCAARREPTLFGDVFLT